MYKKIIIGLFLFILVGELMVRLDQKFKFYEDTRLVRVPTEVKMSEENRMLKEHKINLEGNNLRIMVIGDSYIAGAGLAFKDKFSQQLKSILKKNIHGFDDIFVLDVTKPGSNTLDNDETYFKYADSFKPDFVIIGYNYNDIWDNLEKNRPKIAEIKSPSTGNKVETKTVTDKEHRNYIFIKKIFGFIHKSSLLDYILKNIHKELKFHGIILPNTVMDLTMKSYEKNNENWKKSKVLLQEVIDDTHKNNSQLIILKFQETNLLEHTELFTKTDKIIKDFFTQSPSVIYINGGDLFTGEKARDYFLSKYDGHPNDKAIKKAAIEVSHFIVNSSGNTGKLSIESTSLLPTGYHQSLLEAARKMNK